MSKLIGVGVLIAIVLALVAYSMSGFAYVPVVNNTDLGNLGTGEVVAGTKYFANNSKIDVYIITHTVNTGQDIRFNFSINDVDVWSYDKRSAILDEHHSAMISVPKGASWELNVSTAIHHYEVRAYPYVFKKIR